MAINWGLTFEGKVEGHTVTLVEFELDGPLEPGELKNVQVPEVNAKGGVIIGGKGPIWLYAHLVHEYHATAWVATYDPRQGAVVVTRHHKDAPALGTVLDPSKVTV